MPQQCKFEISKDILTPKQSLSHCGHMQNKNWANFPQLFPTMPKGWRLTTDWCKTFVGKKMMVLVKITIFC
jgi:hypothetical protein